MTALPDKYSVQRTLGTGSSGTVVLAVDTQLDRPVAIKELAPALAADPGFLERFRDEARTMARLDNDHCVRVFEFLEAPGQAWLVSEFIDGASLRAIVDKAGPMTPEQSLGVIKGALQGLGAAHELGLVHRDVKPENMLSDREGVSKLADFGQAVPGSIGPGAAGGMGSGTAAYMSPEQAAGGEVGPRSDLYSAGIVLYELLTGRVPFSGDNALAVMRKHINQAVPDARTVKPDLPEPVALMLATATAHDPADRPESAAALLEQLEGAAVAAYGEDWEERSSHKKLVLAALAALGLLGASTAGAAAAGSVGAAVVGGTPWALIAAGVLGAAVILGGGYYVVKSNLLGQHSSAVVATSSPTATSASTPGGAPAATPSVAPGPSPSSSPSSAPSPAPGPSLDAPLGGPPGTTAGGSPTPPTQVARRPGPVPSPTHTFILSAAQNPGTPPSLTLSSPRIFFQQCDRPPFSTPGASPQPQACGFFQDGSPYYSPDTAYPSSRGMDCSYDGAWSIAEQYDFTNTYSVDISVTVTWNTTWADKRQDQTSQSSGTIKAGSSGTHDATTSVARAQPTIPSSDITQQGNSTFTLSWTDPSGPHVVNVEQPMYWVCGPPPAPA